MRLSTLTLFLATSLALTACGGNQQAKDNKDTKKTEPAVVATTNSKILSTGLVYASLAQAIQEQKIEGDARACLVKADPLTLASPIQGVIAKHLTAEELKSIDDAYAQNGIGERLLKFMTDNMLVVLGVNQTLPELSVEDQKALQELSTLPANVKLESIPKDEVIKFADENLAKEFQRCNLPVPTPTATESPAGTAPIEPAKESAPATTETKESAPATDAKAEKK